MIGVADRWLGYGPIRIRHRSVAQVNSPVHAGWARDVLLVGRQTLFKAALVEITQYEFGCISRQSVKCLCHIINMLGGSIHVGSGCMLTTVANNLGNSRGRYSGRSETVTSSMSGVQSRSRTITCLHQRSFTYRQTPQPLSFPVASLSRSSRVAHQNPSIKVSWSDTQLSNQVSANAKRKASLCSLKMLHYHDVRPS